MVIAEKQYKVIGTRPIRPDGTDKVIGRAVYGADVRLTGMLYGKVKRSPHAHAIIKKIDASKALALPGVRAVITRDDFPVPLGPDADALIPIPVVLDKTIAGKKALFRGHAVAAVAATDPHIAEDALDLIEVEYDVLPAVLDPKEAMKEGAPILNPEMRTKAPLGLTAPDKPTNVAAHRQFVKGDVDAGFAEADIIVEDEFWTPRHHQGYIEPHNAVAFWNKDGHLTTWGSTQGLFGNRNTLSGLFQIPVSQITVEPVEIGGGFGGKLLIYLEPLAAVLSRKTGKPVKITMTRDEVFEATGPTSSSYVRARLGAKRDGTFVAAEAQIIFDAGAYPGSPLLGALNGAFVPYDIPNLKVDGYDVLVNLSKTAAYRAPGTPAGMLCPEALVNEMAARLGRDPLDLRIQNAAKEGTVRASGQKFARIGAFEVMEAMKNHPHYRSELQGANRGRGVAMGFWGNGGNETSSSASVEADGTVSLVLGSVDIGGSRASLSMMLAETLGVPGDQVHPRIVGTDQVGFTMNTGGSRTTYAGGWAVYELGLQIREKMRQRAAKIWECDLADVTYDADQGVIRGPSDSEVEDRVFTFAELAKRLPSTGGTFEVGANVNYNQAGPAFAGAIVDIEVDKDTGKTTILRFTMVQDVGTAIHPSYVEGQIQGATAQGIGMALNEDYYFAKDGRMVNASFLDYRMPTTLDLPMIETVLVEVPNPGHPYGVRGVGEVPIVPPMAAVHAAMKEATGINFTEMPMSPQRVIEGLLDKNGSAGSNGHH